MEKILTPVSGFLVLIISVLAFIAGIYLIVVSAQQGGESGMHFLTPILFIVAFFLMKGLTIINPNQAIVCTFFGKYVGSIKSNGLLFVNPLYNKTRLSQRSNNFESTKLESKRQNGQPC